jgi:hypothetical protein
MERLIGDNVVPALYYSEGSVHATQEGGLITTLSQSPLSMAVVGGPLRGVYG